MTCTPPGLALIADAELLKQGAEGVSCNRRAASTDMQRVYLNESLFGTPSVYWPEPGPSAGPSAATTTASESSASAPSAPPATSAPTNDCASLPVIIKHRFPKTYRHPTLDAALTKSRLQFEARSLWRCSRLGLRVPQVYFVDEACGCLGLERVDGWSVREVLGGGAEGEVEVERIDEVELDAGVRDLSLRPQEDEAPEDVEDSEGLKALTEQGRTVQDLMRAIGTALGTLHAAGIIHGDLTTSNMMLARDGGVVLIDFGLSSQASMPEHYAVDLYVLERAFVSTHPGSKALFELVLDSYAAAIPKKWKSIESKLKDGEWARSLQERASVMCRADASAPPGKEERHDGVVRGSASHATRGAWRRVPRRQRRSVGTRKGDRPCSMHAAGGVDTATPGAFRGGDGGEWSGGLQDEMFGSPEAD